MEQELEIASNDPGHPLRVLEDLGSAEYGAFSQTAHLMAQAWGLRQNLALQRGSFLSWMRVPGDVLMPCICPTGETMRHCLVGPRGARDAAVYARIDMLAWHDVMSILSIQHSFC